MKAKGPDKLTDKQLRCGTLYAGGGYTKAAAYREVYDCHNMAPQTIRRKALELFDNPGVRRFVEESRQEAVTKLGITVERLVREYAHIAFCNAADFYDIDGNLKAPADLTPEQQAAFKGIKIGQGGPELQIHDKLSALHALGVHVGLFKPELTDRGAKLIIIDPFGTDPDEADDDAD